LDHPDVRALIQRAEEVILAGGKPMGTVPNAGASTRQLFERGYRMVVGAHDLIMLREAGRAAVRDCRGFRKVAVPP
ncbi:MAG: 4-hydroxy-2-oxovalerate aldolase, partial [Geminicoccaceae bacterium]